jgi:hypothetical protein
MFMEWGRRRGAKKKNATLEEAAAGARILAAQNFSN